MPAAAAASCRCRTAAPNPMNHTSRRTFIIASTVSAGAAALPSVAAAAPSTTFDRATFEARIRQPFRHRQVFAAGAVADGAVLGFMANSLDAYEHGFGEGPGTLHVAAVFYRTAVMLALDDDAWRSLDVASLIRAGGDRTSAAPGEPNPYLGEARGRSIPELIRRGTCSFFICENALRDVARHASAGYETLRTHLVPGTVVVPAGVAAVNALQEEHFTFFNAVV